MSLYGSNSKNSAHLEYGGHNLAHGHDSGLPAGGARRPILETEKLRCRFGGLEALSGVSVSIQPQTVVVLLGRNGAGKSSFINCVSGYNPIHSGRVIFDGEEIDGLSGWRIARRGLARTFQVPQPIAGLTVETYVGLSALHGGQRRLARRAATSLAQDVLNTTGLMGRARAKPTELSTAELRRLELARALALRPKLLLLDEPLAGLAPSQVEPYLQILMALRDAGLSIVAVEHSVRAVLDIADEVIFLERGVVARQGPPREVLSDRSVVETYLGSRFTSRVFL